MRRVFYIALLILAVIPLSAQKLVIGSDIPSFKSVRDGISWLAGQPEELHAMMIDFYSPSNKTCVANLERIVDIASKHRGKLDVVVISRATDPKLERYSGKIFVGIDSTDNGFFSKCYVKYLPYTMIVDGKKKLLWHGILNTLSDETLEERVRAGEE